MDIESPPKKIYLFPFEGRPDEWVWCDNDESERGDPVLVYRLEEVRPGTPEPEATP